MSQTLLQLRTAIRSNIEEPTAGYWADADLGRYVNQSIRHMNRQLRYFIEETPGTISLVANQRTYGLAADCPGPERIYRITTAADLMIDGTSMPMMRGNTGIDMVDGTTSGTATPTDWLKFGKKLGFYPIPAGSSANAVYYWYLETPTVLTADVDVSPYSDEYDDAVEWYATWMALMVKGEIEKAQHFKGMYVEMKEEILATLAVFLSGPRKSKNNDAVWMFQRTGS